MKVIFDFDGTLTNVQQEYERELAAFSNRALALCEHRMDIWQPLLKNAFEEVEAYPGIYGWLDNNRITTYADEDLFAKILGVTQCLDIWLATQDERVAALAAFLPSGFSFLQLACDAHDDMNAAPLCNENGLEHDALYCIQEMLDQQNEIVIVSNSHSSRIIEKLERAGLKPVNHEDNNSAQFRVRGFANKFVLDEVPNFQAFGSRKIDVNRPSYRTIIEEERPLAVVGDVFSLDLAVPLYLSMCDPLPYENMQLYLRLRPYTPEWAKRAIHCPPPGVSASLRFLQEIYFLPELMRKFFY